MKGGLLTCNVNQCQLRNEPERIQVSFYLLSCSLSVLLQKEKGSIKRESIRRKGRTSKKKEEEEEEEEVKLSLLALTVTIHLRQIRIGLLFHGAPFLSLIFF